MKNTQRSLLAPALTISCALLSPHAFSADEPDPWDPKPPVVEDELYKHKLSLGYLMLRPQGVGHGLDVSIPTAILPSAQNFTAENIETRVGESNTIGLFYSYAIDQHWGIEVFGGIPPEVELYGSGVAYAPVTVLQLPPLPIIGNLPLFGGQLQAGGLTELLNAGDPANNPIATAKAWSPTIITTYTFFDKNALIRPYLGLGMTYGFLTDIKINPHVTESLNEKGALIALLTLNPDASTVSIEGEADPFFSAVGTVGVDVNLTEKFGLKASASYIPSSTDVRLKIKDSKGQQIGEATTNIPIDPFIFFVAVSYRFNL
ncbi:MAG: OmpW/AlkL family protein [Moraxellaceae bacterium]